MPDKRTAHTRALLVGPFPPPIGGDTVLTANLSRSPIWAANGIELECIDTSAGDRVRLPDEPLRFADVARGVRVVCRVAARIRRCNVVLLWCNNRFAVTAGLGVAVCCRLAGRPLLVKVFGAYLAKRISALNPLWRRCAASLLGGVECLFAETKALTGELVEDARLPADRIVWLPNFIADETAAGPRPAAGFSGKCVFFGQVKREKGVFEIVEALGGHDGVSCDFYGPLVERDERAFLDAVAAHPNLAYRGVAEPATVSRTAAEYDVLLLPTFHPSEGYPAVILEAYAAGVPVIATRWRSIPEIVVDGSTGFLVPIHAPEAMRAAIERLGAEPGRYAAMRRNAAEFARGFSESEIVGRMLMPRVIEAAARRRRLRG